MKRDLYAEKRLSEALLNCSLFSKALCYESVGSTNDIAKEEARRGAVEGTVVMAHEQTAGRGRMGRTFHSPLGDGLYMSLVLRLASCDNLGLITAGAAVSMRRAVYDVSGTWVDIKWVNDLLYEGKKLCGILAEGQFSSEGDSLHIVLGVGINLRRPAMGYHPDIQGKTISLEEINSTAEIDAIALAAAFIRQFSALYKALPQADFLSEYKEACCLMGKEIRYQKEGITYRGRVMDIDDEAGLVIVNERGEREVLFMGEVSLVREDI